MVLLSEENTQGSDAAMSKLNPQQRIRMVDQDIRAAYEAVKHGKDSLLG